MANRIGSRLFAMSLLVAMSGAGCTGGPGVPVDGALTVSAPLAPFPSNGDLWLSTWADNDAVFVSWGDGIGPMTSLSPPFPASTHNGLARLQGTFPNVSFTVVNRSMPFSDEEYNSKPGSLLFLQGRLYVAIHRPLMHPEHGFTAYSDDYGQTFSYPQDGSTWTTPSKFVCRVFLNMGRGYDLNTDGYVYIYGIGSEIDWDVGGGGRIYLARAPKDEILNLGAWKYFAGLDSDRQPVWAGSEGAAQAIAGVSSQMLFSAIYHPGLQQYLIMTAETVAGHLYRADHPWGPWTRVGQWFPQPGSAWANSYMPGVITKNTGTNSFFFATGGVHEPGSAREDSRYRFRLGMMTLREP